VNTVQSERETSLANGWELFPDFVMRTTGFPYEWLEELRCLRSFAQAERVLEVERVSEQFRDQVMSGVFDSIIEYEQTREPNGSKVFSTLYKVRKYLTKQKVIPAELLTFWQSRKYSHEEWALIPERWNDIMGELEAAWLLGEQVFDTEIMQARNVMKDRAQDPRFLEAVFLSSPSSHDGLSRYLKQWQNDQMPKWNSDARSKERMIFAYLQRFCSKNDTASFFGPVNYGRFDGTTASAVQRAFREEYRLGRRRVFVAHWVVKELAKKIAMEAEVLPHLKPRANPLVRSLGGNKFFFHGINRSFSMQEQQARLFQAIDGAKTVREVADELELGSSEAVTILQDLAKKRLVDLDLVLSPFQVDALVELRDRLLQLPTEVRATWLDLIDRIEESRVELENTPYPKRVHAWENVETWLAKLFGREMRRKDGGLYADRTALYEDCAGTIAELTIGGSLYQALTGSMQTVIDLLMAVAVCKWLDHQEVGKQIYVKMSQTQSVVRYIDMIPRMDQTQSELSNTRELLSRLEERLRSRLTEQEGPLSLSQDDVRELLQPYEEQIQEVLTYLKMSLPSPDIMVAADSAEAVERGEFQLILGELHDDCSTIFDGFMAYFHEDPQTLRARLDARIRATSHADRMASVVTERRNKHVTPELPGLSILLSSTSGKEQEQVVPIHELEVREVEGRLCLWAKGQPIITYPGDLHSVAHGCFSLPCVVPIDFQADQTSRDVHHMKRIVVDGVVVQRERWRVAAKTLEIDTRVGKGFGLYVHFKRKQSELGLPDQFYVKWGKGEKPILVDLRIPWSLEWLQRVTEQSDSLLISEMYPGPNDLWWRDDIGTHTFELRTGYFYDDTAKAVRDV
jgi:hypothetical protein